MRKASALILSLVLIISIHSFSASNAFKNWLNNSIIETENTGTLTTDDKVVVFGGGFRMKTPTVNFQPFQVQLPSFRAGCGGIDISFGAFSYFKPEQLVNFLKAVAAQAPAYAFTTAIATLCPQCNQIMEKLTALANQINSLNYNSCEAAQFFGKKTGKWFGDNLNKSLGSGSTGPDWLSTFNEYADDALKFISDAKNIFKDNGCDPDKRGCPAHFIYNSSKKSLLSYIMEDIPHFKDDKEAEKFIRGLIGDFIKRDTSGEGKIKIYYISNAIMPQSKSALKAVAIGNGTGSCKPFTFPYGEDENGKVVSTNIVPICGYVAQHIDSIINKVKTRTPLSQDDLTFLSLYRIPAYQIINTLSLQPGALQAARPYLIKYLSYELAYEILSRVFSETRRMLYRFKEASENDVVPIRESDIKQMVSLQGQVLSQMQVYVAEAQDEFSKNIKKYFQVHKLKTMFMASLARHPIMGSRLYAKTLLGF